MFARVAAEPSPPTLTPKGYKVAAWVRDVLLAAFGSICMWQLTRLVTSVDSLNDKMATVVTQQVYFSRSLEDHESRLRILESKKK